jgi:hypothetical protein
MLREYESSVVSRPTGKSTGRGDSRKTGHLVDLCGVDRPCQLLDPERDAHLSNPAVLVIIYRTNQHAAPRALDSNTPESWGA